MRFSLGSKVPFALSALAVALSAPVHAQGMLEEVIVTASKRQQTLQEAPLAVSVVTAQAIERAEIRDLLDIQSVVPSLRVSQLQNSTQTNFIIRGFGNGANNPGIEPSVAVFVDGVYRSRSQGRISDLPNIERIEVLRGPQSTLYGKNASAGVISVVTAKPQFETEGYIEAGIGNYNQSNVRGYITGPINEKLAYSLGGSYFERDGYADNITLGTDQNNRDRYALRGELLFTPSEKTDLRFIFDYDELDEICCAVANLVNGPTGAAMNFLAGGEALDPANPYSYRFFTNLDPQTTAENWGFTADFTTQLGDIEFRSITGYRDSTADQPFGDVDYTGADVIGNNRYDTVIETFTQEFRLTGSSESLDWTAGLFYFDETIDYEVGLFYGPQFRNYANFLVGAGNPLVGEATFSGLEAALSLPQGSFFQEDTGVVETATQDNQTLSIFGQVDFHVTDRLTATVGISYLDDEKDTSLIQDNTDVFSQLALAGADAATVFTNAALAEAFPAVFGLPLTSENIGLVTSTPAGLAGFQQLLGNIGALIGSLDLSDPAVNSLLGLQPLQFLPGLLNYPNAGNSGQSQDDKLTYTLRLAYDLSDSINVYASYATGYKATSWNLSRDSRPTAAERDAVVASGGTLPNNLTLGTRFAGPEESEVFELGAKWVQPWGYVNIALFDQTIEGFQSNVFTGTGFALANAGEQSVQGAEVDLVFQATESLTLGWSATWLDPKYDSFASSAIGDITGTQPGGIHTFSMSTSAAYNFSIGDIDGFIQIDHQYDNEVDILDGEGLNPDNLLLATTGNTSREVNMLNASMGLAMGNWELRVWGRNLTEDEYLITVFPSVAQAGSYSGYPNQPRTYGASLRYSF